MCKYMYIILCMFHVTCLLCYSIVIYGNPNTCCGYIHVAKSLSAMQIYVNMYIDTYATWRFYTSWKFYTFEQINYSVFQKPRNLNLACLECSFYTLSEPHQWFWNFRHINFRCYPQKNGLPVFGLLSSKILLI